jgi:hypothetical protein
MAIVTVMAVADGTGRGVMIRGPVMITDGTAKCVARSAGLVGGIEWGEHEHERGGGVERGGMGWCEVGRGGVGWGGVGWGGVGWSGVRWDAVRWRGEAWSGVERIDAVSLSRSSTAKDGRACGHGPCSMGGEVREERVVGGDE